MHFSVMQLALILGIIVLLFGTKKLTNVGGDVGAAIRNFRTEMKRGQGENDEAHNDENDKVIEGEATKTSADAHKFKKKDNVK
ncbi:MAG: twin-arginine translocase TatA/TatE family subunit [Methylococcaceae bacterium]|jgi:sec-independent protein translocase protein TatA|nr:twin-arginine translocase TatA/TatE family subunit [Methylococcales bacterium]MSR16827.1 twin-arginine translocase TatA/TatE family subunit [Methylococcaceae bacterium]GDX85611.1 Sec-independent protein translocase protein TatA [Methylococcaceae bacterium]